MECFSGAARSIGDDRRRAEEARARARFLSGLSLFSKTLNIVVQVDVRQMAKRMRAVERHAEDEQLLQPRENAYLRLNTNTSQLVCGMFQLSYKRPLDIQKCLSEYGSVSASTTFPGASTIEQVRCCFTNSLFLNIFDSRNKTTVTERPGDDVHGDSTASPDLGCEWKTQVYCN